MGRIRIGIVIALLLIGGIFAYRYVTKEDKQKREQETPVQDEDIPKEEEEEKVQSLGIKVVVDPGHGGFDPGKVNTEGVIEKDLNLQIGLLLKEELEKQGIEVIMTRDSDKGLYAETSRSKKTEDLQNRCRLIEETAPLCTISIHQNSFPDESVYGPQVFYYHTSEASAQLAGMVQESLNTNLSIEKPRETKNNESYYMLKKSPSTTIIVECGFLSCPEEAQKLVSEEYQRQLVGAVRQGVMQYINNMQTENESK